MNYFIPLDLLLSAGDWLSSDDLAALMILPAIKAALEFKGMLTAVLTETYGSPVVVECLRQSEWIDGAGLVGLRRDVFLKLDHIPRVAASTLMPAGVLEAYPWLANLGSRPLGEMLENHTRYRKSAFEFIQLDANPIFRLGGDAARYTWARRYKFELDAGNLQVMETFFPGVLEQFQASLIRLMLGLERHQSNP